MPAAQEWLLERLVGLEARDFQGIKMVSTIPFRPPRRLESVWIATAEDLTFTHEDIAQTGSVVIFCNPYEEEELVLLASIVDRLDGLGNEAPCLIWAPHSMKHPGQADNTRQDFSKSPWISNLLHAGLDGIVAGEPAGLYLTMAVRAQVAKAAYNARLMNESTGGALDRVQHAARLKDSIHHLLWEYLCGKIARSIPPLDRRLPAGKPRRLSDYKVGSLLGRGTYGYVYNLIRQDEDEACDEVLKVVDKKGIKDANDLKDLACEIDLMVLLHSPVWQHPNIVQLYQVYQSSTHILFRMENGGAENLYRRLADRDRCGDDQRPLQCRKVCSLMSQAAEAMRHLHVGPHVCHRDIKPENYIISEPDSEHIILKVADFGLAIIREGGKKCSIPCGTIPFCAPEVHLAKEYDGFAADVWSFGTVVLELVCGLRTLEKALSLSEKASHMTTARKIQATFADTSFTGNHLQENIRMELRDIIHPTRSMLNGLLDVNPATRWSISQAKAALVDANMYVDESQYL